MPTITRQSRSLSRPWMLLFIFVGVLVTPARAWDENGHVIVTRLAFKKLPDKMPDWLKTPAVRARLEYLSAEPDRWRGQHNVHLDHINSPNHYMDEELLFPYGLSFEKLPQLRREFLDILATQRAQTPEKFDPYDRKKDRKYTRLVPGLLPYHVAELQWKLAASWTTLKTYKKHRDYVSDEMFQNARQNIVYHMGIISHFVADGAQPLHTTEHYNGWAGDNPKGYTTDKGFHSRIDGGVLRHHGITPDSLAARALPPKDFNVQNYWREIINYLQATFAQVEPLYALEKSGDLDKEPGKKFIEDRLLEAGSMLVTIWTAAHDGAHIDDFRVQQLLRNKPKPKPVP
ncbi:MAG: hypothetical protein V3W34_02965 [Phycisphaerae bacterium]